MRQQHRAAAAGSRDLAGGQRHVRAVARAAVGILVVHQLDDFRQRLADREIGIGAGERRRGGIHELDDAGLIGGDDRITQRLQRAGAA